MGRIRPRDTFGAGGVKRLPEWLSSFIHQEESSMRKFAALLVATAFAGTTMVAFAAEEAKPMDKPADKPAVEKKHHKAKKEAPMKEAPAAAPAVEKK